MTRATGSSLSRSVRPCLDMARGLPIALRVLLVEDDETDALLVLRELRRGGFEPAHLRVQDAAAMRRALVEQPWDMIISDYHMPEFDAPGALRVLAETGLDLPLVIVSGTM